MRATPRVAGVPGRDASATAWPARRGATRWVGAKTRTAVAVSMDAARVVMLPSRAT